MYFFSHPKKKLNLIVKQYFHLKHIIITLKKKHHKKYVLLLKYNPIKY